MFSSQNTAGTEQLGCSTVGNMGVRVIKCLFDLGHFTVPFWMKAIWKFSKIHPKWNSDVSLTDAGHSSVEVCSPGPVEAPRSVADIVAVVENPTDWTSVDSSAVIWHYLVDIVEMVLLCRCNEFQACFVFLC